MSKLEVPDEAELRLVRVVSRRGADLNPTKDEAGWIATPVVVAELRTIARHIEQGEGSHRWAIAERVNARANELEAGAS